MDLARDLTKDVFPRPGSEHITMYLEADDQLRLPVRIVRTSSTSRVPQAPTSPYPTRSSNGGASATVGSNAALDAVAARRRSTQARADPGRIAAQISAWSRPMATPAGTLRGHDPVTSRIVLEMAASEGGAMSRQMSATVISADGR